MTTSIFIVEQMNKLMALFEVTIDLPSIKQSGQP